MAYLLTSHARKRMKQRGLRLCDLDLLLSTGDQIGPDAYLMTNEVADREIACLKAEIQHIERLRGKKLVVDGNTVITSYHASRRNQVQTYRRGKICA